ncbi:MAG: hypothetical protein CMQ27_03100 [Gammaproteobacteria bacterium]|nr:hypothetical protein [Gammaproteobacteria bacterium]
MVDNLKSPNPENLSFEPLSLPVIYKLARYLFANTAILCLGIRDIAEVRDNKNWIKSSSSLFMIKLIYMNEKSIAAT